MTDKQLLKAQAALKAWKDSKLLFKCNVCGYIIKLAPPIPEKMNHKNCTGQFIKE